MGIFLGTLPDLFPAALSRLPYFAKLNAALGTLSDFRATEGANTALNKDDNGYVEIYRLLHAVDPFTLPPLDETLALQGDGSGQLVGVKSGVKWNAVSGDRKSQKAMETVYVCFRTPQNTGEPICELSELKFLVRDVEIRVCSRLGFFFAFVALLLGEGVSLRNALKKRKGKKQPCPITDSTVPSKGTPPDGTVNPNVRPAETENNPG